MDVASDLEEKKPSVSPVADKAVQAEAAAGRNGNQLLYAGSSITVAQFCILAIDFQVRLGSRLISRCDRIRFSQTRRGMEEAAMEEWLCLLTAVLPQPNHVPTFTQAKAIIDRLAIKPGACGCLLFQIETAVVSVVGCVCQRLRRV